MPSSRQARIAGWLFLLLIVLAPIRLIYLPSILFTGEPSTTVANLRLHEQAVRTGVVADLACGALMVFIVLSLRRLFAADNDTGRGLLMLGGALPAAVYTFNVGNDIAALTFAQGPAFLQAFDAAQREALALLFLRLHGQMVIAAEIWWGLWLLPLAMLVRRSGHVPGWIGTWLFVNGLAYVAQSAVGLLWPGHAADTLSSVCTPLQFGEVVFALWLVIVGVRRSPRSMESIA